MNNKERQAWFEPSGYQSKMFGHVEGFLAYAAEAFGAGKRMVLGLCTPVFATVHEARGLVAGGESVADVFNSHDKLRRFGTAIAIRLVERDGRQGIQVVSFCPWDRHQWIRDSWQPYNWRLRLWKDGMVAAVEAWAADKKVPIHEGYSGGSIRVRKDRDHDSVGMCAGWLMRVVMAAEKTIPGATTDDEWEWQDVCFFKKLENWQRENAAAGDEEGEGDKMDIDMED